jgi:hypothetical protein
LGWFLHFLRHLIEGASAKIWQWNMAHKPPFIVLICIYRAFS